MAYRKPSVAIYQILENAGGAANATPDLQSVIIGPLYNIVKADPTDSTSLTKSKSIDITNWSGATADFELPLNDSTAFPGQKVVTKEVEVLLKNPQVQTYEFSFDLLKNKDKVDKSLFEIPVTGAKFGDTEYDPTAALPGNRGAHVRAGDLVIVETTAKTYTTIVVGVESANGKKYLRVANPIDYVDNTPLLATFKIYHTFDFLQVDKQFLSFNSIQDAVAKVTLSRTARPFPNAANPSDYVFRAPSETTGYDAIETYVGYRAQRLDTISTLLTINDPSDRTGKLGVASELNPLSLGVSIAQQNTTTSIRALAVESDDAEGYSKALDLIETEKVYCLVALNQDINIANMLKAHCVQLSQPVEAMWRMAIVNTALPEFDYIGARRPGDAPASEAAHIIKGDDGSAVLEDKSAQFISDKIQAGDKVVILTGTDDAAKGEFTVVRALNNTMVQLKEVVPVAQNTTYYVRRDLSRRQQAERVAATSENFKSNRVVHVMPPKVGIKIGGVMKYLPGYYLACGIAGMVAGFPVQQGFTNIGVVGIDDLSLSNYYFTREELNLMAGAGTCLFVQDTQGGMPYCRHELTTDMSVLEYREILKVKNWDYLSYFYHDLLDDFIGQWNITEDTLTTIRQTIISASENLLTQKLPKIGAPLISYEIQKLEQNATNKDTIDVRIKTEIVSPNNYNDVQLVI